MGRKKDNEVYQAIFSNLESGENYTLDVIKRSVEKWIPVEEFDEKKISKACGYLKEIGYIKTSGRAKYVLTEAGEIALKTINEEEIDKQHLSPLIKEIRHELFVKNQLDPKGYLSGRNRVYGYINQIRRMILEESSYEEIFISLVTPAMVSTDEQFFNPEQKEAWRRDYSPYYYDFQFIVTEDDHPWREMKKKLEIEAEVPIQRRIWFSAELTDNPGDGILGTLAFGGSESWAEKVYLGKVKKLTTSDEARLDTIYTIKKNSVSDDIQECFKGTIFEKNSWGSLPQASINIFNVGQGNCIQVKTVSFKLLFDTGFAIEKLENQKTRYKWENKDYLATDPISPIDISQCSSDCNIISHWHRDHLQGYHHLRDASFFKKWIFPEIKKEMPLEGTRLIKYLLYIEHKYPQGKTRVYVVPDGNGRLIYSNGTNRPRFEIWKGSRSSTVSNTAASLNTTNDADVINNDSLIIRINNTLLPSDSLYRYWPKELRDDLDSVEQLIVPHHGSTLVEKRKNKKGRWEENTDAFAENSRVIDEFKSLRECVLCFGDNPYKHPNKEHMQKLFETMGKKKIVATGGKVKANDIRPIDQYVEIKNDKITLKT